MRPGPAAVLALLVAALLAPVMPVSAQTCVTSQYLASLRDSQAALNSAPPEVARARAAALQAGALTRGAPLSPVIDDLSIEPPDLPDARRRIDALVATLDVPAGSSCHLDQHAALDALRGVYGSRVFDGLDGSAGRSLPEQAVDLLAGILATVSRPVGPAVTAALILGLAGTLIAAVRWTRTRRPASPRGERISDVEGPVPTDPDTEWAAAASAAARGHHREAIRRAFRSSLLAITTQRRLPVDPSWTTGQLLGRAHQDPDLLAALTPAAVQFDRAWYSGERIDAGDWEEAREKCEALRGLARRSPAAWR